MWSKKHIKHLALVHTSDLCPIFKKCLNRSSLVFFHISILQTITSPNVLFVLKVHFKFLPVSFKKIPLVASYGTLINHETLKLSIEEPIWTDLSLQVQSSPKELCAFPVSVTFAHTISCMRWILVLCLRKSIYFSSSVQDSQRLGSLGSLNAQWLFLTS